MADMYQEFATAVGEARVQPAAAFAALEKLAARTVGAKLFTLMEFEFATGLGRRIYSNKPDAYPVSGRKPLPPGRWSNEVIEKKRNFVANDIEGIAEVFPDHEIIRSLGCESVVNIPIAVGGEVVGTINCLDVAGAYTSERLAFADSLVLPGIACFLLSALRTRTGK